MLVPTARPLLGTRPHFTTPAPNHQDCALADEHVPREIEADCRRVAGLVRFLDDPLIPLDNNQTKPGMRGWPSEMECQRSQRRQCLHEQRDRRRCGKKKPRQVALPGFCWLQNQSSFRA